MNCSEINQLLLKPNLTEQEIRILRSHAHECPRCAAELEGALLALDLSDEAPVSPSASFADRVMEKVQAAPAPGKLTAEQWWATGGFIASVIGLTLLGAFVRGLVLSRWAQGFAFNVSMEPVKHVLAELLHYGTLALKVLTEAAKVWAEASPAANLWTAVGVGVLLLVVLFSPKMKGKTAKIALF